MYPIPDHADYKIAADRRKGTPYDALSDLDERTLAEHDTSTHERGAPCDSCGKPWPCGAVRFIIASE